MKFYPGSSREPQYYFYSKDHLGNIRSVVTKNPSTNEITEVQQTHYYPFGGIIADISSGTSVQNKLYNGQGSCKRVERKLAFNFPSAAEAQPKVKEFDRMHGLDWYDYGARWMDASIGRWHSVDPLCEKYYDVSPYAYCMNNPVKFIDIYGLEAKEPIIKVTFSIGLRAGVSIGKKFGAAIDMGSFNYEFGTNAAYASKGVSFSCGKVGSMRLETTYKEYDINSSPNSSKFKQINHVKEKKETSELSFGLGLLGVSNTKTTTEVSTNQGIIKTSEKKTDLSSVVSADKSATTKSEYKSAHGETTQISINAGIGVSVDVDVKQIISTLKDIILNSNN